MVSISFWMEYSGFHGGFLFETNTDNDVMTIDIFPNRGVGNHKVITPIQTTETKCLSISHPMKVNPCSLAFGLLWALFGDNIVHQAPQPRNYENDRVARAMVLWPGYSISQDKYTRIMCIEYY